MKVLVTSLIFVFSLSMSECNDTPCFSDREVSKKISDIELMCSINGEMTLLNDVKNGTRYSVCNATSYELKDSTTYTISGIVYEVKPNERWPGTPFEITKLKN